MLRLLEKRNEAQDGVIQDGWPVMAGTSTLSVIGRASIPSAMFQADLAEILGDLDAKFLVALGIDLGHRRLAMPQHHLGRLQPELVADLRPRGVTQPVRVPLRHRLYAPRNWTNVLSPLYALRVRPAGGWRSHVFLRNTACPCRHWPFVAVAASA